MPPKGTQEKIIMSIITNTSTAISNPAVAARTLNRLIPLEGIDILNYNGQNLIYIALKAYKDPSSPVLIALKKLNPTEFEKAQDMIQAEVPLTSIYASTPTETEPLAESGIQIVEPPVAEAAPIEVAPPPTPRTLLDAVRDSGSDLQQIINDGADINEKIDGFTPAQIAAINRQLGAVRILLENNADTTGLDIAIFLGNDDSNANEAIINYVTQKGLYTLEELTRVASGDDKYNASVGPLLAKLGNISVYLPGTKGNALHNAVDAEATANIKTAVKRGIPVDSINAGGLTALQESVLNTKKDAFKVLVEENADIFVEEPTTGANILHLAARMNNTAMATEIMQLESAQGLAKGKDSTGANPLHTASTLGQADVMKVILDRLPDEVKQKVVNATDHAGHSVLSMAKDDTTRTFLTEHGAVEPVAEEPATVIDAEPETLHVPTEPSTPPKQITKATSCPPTPASAMKLPAAIDPEVLSPLTQLLEAVGKNDAQGVQNALDRVERPMELLNTELVVDNGQTTRSDGNELQSTTVLQLTHALGMGDALGVMTDIWVNENWFKLVVVAAIEKNNVTMLTQLLSDDTNLHNMKFNIVNADAKGCAGHLVGSNGSQSVWVNFGATQNTASLLHVAAVLGGNDKILKILLNRNIEINAQDSNGYTPMHWAVASKNTAMIKALKTHNADLTITNCGDQDTPAEMAAHLGNREIYKEIGDKLSCRHMLLAIQSKKQPMFQHIMTQEPMVQKQLLAFMSVNKYNVLHYIAKYGIHSMAGTVNEINHARFNELVAHPDVKGDLPLHIAATRDKALYDEFCNILSVHEKTVTTKGGFLGLKKTSSIEYKNLAHQHNGNGQTPQEVYGLCELHRQEAQRVKEEKLAELARQQELQAKLTQDQETPEDMNDTNDSTPLITHTSVFEEIA